MRLCEKVTTRALRFAVFPSRSHARSRITREEEPLCDRVEAADLANWRGVPVKADAVAAIRAKWWMALADFIIGRVLLVLDIDRWEAASGVALGALHSGKTTLTICNTYHAVLLMCWDA